MQKENYSQIDLVTDNLSFHPYQTILRSFFIHFHFKINVGLLKLYHVNIYLILNVVQYLLGSVKIWTPWTIPKCLCCFWQIHNCYLKLKKRMILRLKGHEGNCWCRVLTSGFNASWHFFMVVYHTISKRLFNNTLTNAVVHTDRGTQNRTLAILWNKMAFF